jgi:PAS domain S-box-containing protein
MDAPTGTPSPTGTRQPVSGEVSDPRVAPNREGPYHEAILQSAMDGFCCVDLAGRLVEVNEAYCRMSGYEKAELLRLRISELEALETNSDVAARIHKLRSVGHDRFISRHRRKDGSLYDVEVSLQYQPQAGELIFGFMRDVTERKRAETERQLMVELLRLINLNTSPDAHSLTRAVINLLRDWSGCEAVGVRLREDEDFPYYETCGLSADFVRKESQLCALDAQGHVVRDVQDCPVLECLCGKVLRGRVNPAEPCFTRKGSFWTNSTTEWLASAPEPDRQARTRNRCHGEGYESVALVPLRLGQETHGLLQLNDRQPGRFTPGKIAFLENLADSLALALAQCRAQQTLRQDEERYRALFDSSLDAVLITAQDGRVLRANAAACRVFGYSEAELRQLGRDGLFDASGPRLAPSLEGLSRPGSAFGFLRKDGTRFTGEVSASTFTDSRGQACASIVIRDITEREQAAVLLAARAELAELAQRASLDDVVQMALDKAEWLTDSRIGFFHFVDPDQENLRLQQWSTNTVKTMCTAEGKGRHYPISQAGVWVDCLRTRAPVVHNDYAGLPHRKGLPVGHAPVTRQLVVPVFRGGLAVALLGVGNKPTDYTPADVRLVQDLANIVADQALRKQAEALLRERETSYLALFESMTQGAFLQRADGTLVDINAAALRLFGLSRDEFLKRTSLSLAWDVIHEDGSNWPGQDHPSMQALRTGKPVTGLVAGVLNPKTGARVWIEINAIPSFRPGESAPHEVLVTLHDLTERKQAEAQLREQAFWLQESQRVGRIGSYDLDVRAGTWTSSAVLDEILGITPETQRTVESWNALVHPEDRASMLEYFLRHVIEARHPFDREYRIIRPRDGQARWLWGRGELTFDSQGAPLRMIGTIQDITQRKLAELALRESQQRLELAASAAGLGIWDWDILHNNLTWDDRMFRLYGISKRRGHYGIEISEETLYRDDRSRAHAACQAALRGEGDYDLELRVKDSDGTIRHIQTRGIVLRDQEGKAIRMLGISYDVTDRKHLEEQLRQAQKMEAIGQLAGGVAHDFNNILAAIMLHLSMMKQDQSIDRGIRQSLDELLQEAQRAANLTRQLLMFSRRSIMEVKTLDLNGLVTNLLKMLGRLIGEHITLCFKSRQDVPPVRADAGMLEQVLINLCVNARDAMPQSGGTITIDFEVMQVGESQARRHPGVSPGRFVCMSVTDTGCGMDQATLHRIFEPFYTTKELGRGTGLGLATVHGIAGQHGGWVEVESTVGQGTSFRVFLPAATSPVTKPDLPEQLPATKGTETILLVEDEPSLRRAAAQGLRLLGYRVFEAAQGQEALKVWEEHSGSIDLLLSDMVMPGGLSGVDLARQFRFGKPQLKVIICSGYSTEMITAGIHKDSSIIRLQKPYLLESLAKSVRDCLDQRAA